MSKDIDVASGNVLCSLEQAMTTGKLSYVQISNLSDSDAFNWA